MILSKKYKFIFIKGRKVAGTSVEIALSGVCGPDDIITPITPVDERARMAYGGGARNYGEDRETELAYLRLIAAANSDELGRINLLKGRYRHHMSLREVAQAHGDISGFRIVCVERNPYAKLISWANWKVAKAHYLVGGGLRAEEGLLRAYLAASLADGTAAEARNIDLYRDANGHLGVEVLHYERLARDFACFVKSLGIASVPELPHAKQGMSASSETAADFFPPGHRRIINEMFAEEFAAFGYAPADTNPH
ncbi:MAG TPA: hypothetical protein VMB71_12450 [Acetobacteraceae bacterium]|nr:hypothetical protein [Acetobacteraceae bacterium]